MTPEQRAQLQGLSEQLLEDMDLRWQMDQLGAEPAARCSRRWAGTGSYDFSGQDPLGFAEAAADDAGARRPRPAREPAARRHAARARWPRSTSTGPASCWATTRPAASTAWPSWPRCSRRPASSRTRRAASSSRPRGIRRIGQNALERPVQEAGRRQDGHATSSSAPASATSATTTPSPTSSAIRSTSTSSAPSATPSAAPAAARRCALHPGRLRGRAHRAPGAVEHGAHARPVAVDADARQLPAGQEGRDGAALADLDRSSRATTSASSASARWPASSRPSSCPRCRGTSSTARTCSTRFQISPADAGPPERHQADHHDHRRRADRPHHRVGRRVLQLPAGARDGRRHADAR